jgi:hypothetical protein
MTSFVSPLPVSFSLPIGDGSVSTGTKRRLHGGQVLEYPGLSFSVRTTSKRSAAQCSLCYYSDHLAREPMWPCGCVELEHRSSDCEPRSWRDDTTDNDCSGVQYLTSIFHSRLAGSKLAAFREGDYSTVAFPRYKDCQSSSRQFERQISHGFPEFSFTTTLSYQVTNLMVTTSVMPFTQLAIPNMDF